MMARLTVVLALAIATAIAVAAPPTATPPTPPPAAPAAPAAHGGLVDDLDCSACHTPAGWAMSAGAGRGFDHDRTGFPLRGAHAQRPCSSCHQGQGTPPSTCEGCHRDPHARRLGDSCAECHTAAAWSDTATLARHRRCQGSDRRFGAALRPN